MSNTLHQQFLKARQAYIESRFQSLNPVQREAVYKVRGPLLILAGAGSGKTTVLVNRIANLISHGDAYYSEDTYREVNAEDLQALEEITKNGEEAAGELLQLVSVEAAKPYQILAITFTNKAAGELKERLERMLGAGGADVAASTFHSACVRMLRRDADRLGFPQSFTIYDSDDQKRVLKEIYKERNIDDKFLPLRAAASRIGRWKDSMLSPQQAAEDAFTYQDKLVSEIYVQYAQRLKSAGAFDFDDLIYFTVRLLEENDDVRRYYNNRYRYILVDEYQDTSHAQFRLVQLLSAHGNVCVVGDDDQSIYRFRGATVENILGFEQTFPGAQVIRLEQNYRSTGNILAAANNVIENNAHRKGKTLWTSEPEGKKPVLYRAESEQDEAAYIAGVISANVREGIPLSGHAVLYRANAQSNAIENYFSRASIPYKIVGGQRFFDRMEVKDMLAYLSVVVNPADNLRLRRIINVPARKIGATTVNTMAEIAQNLGISLLEVAQQAADFPALSRAHGALAGFCSIYNELKKAYDEHSIDVFTEKAFTITGYEQMLIAAGEEGKTRLENVRELLSSVKTYANEQGPAASLEGFLENVALVSDLDNYDGEQDAVSMMTLHAAKGLEFPVVFMVGMEEGVFPSDMVRYNEEEVEEERRLCYVGITRARKEIYMTCAAYRMLYGQTRRNLPSRFISELGEENMEVLGYTPKERAPRSDYNYSGGGLSSASTLSGYSTPKATTQNDDKPSFEVGDKIDHGVFGLGVVMAVTPIAGDSIVEIEFETAGRKKTMANYAPLTKVEE